MTDKDKKTLRVGGIAVVLIVLGGKVFMPMLNSWTTAGDTLENREAKMEILEQRIESQEKLQTRRDVLSMRIGSLNVLQVIKPEEKVDSDSPEKSKEEKPKAPKEKEAEKTKEPDATKSPIPTIKASSLATYVEKNAKTAGVKIKRIAPQKNTSGRKRTKYFHPTTIQFSFECKIKNLVTLLNDFENGEQFIRIDEIQINRDIKKGDLLTVSMKLSSYEAQENS